VLFVKRLKILISSDDVFSYDLFRVLLLLKFLLYLIVLIGCKKLLLD